MNTNTMIEFDTVKEKWMERTVTTHAKEKIQNMQFYLGESELRKNLKDTTDAREFVETFGAPPLASIDEAKEILLTADKEGCLTPYQLERMASVLTVISRMKDYLNRGKQCENSLAYYEENLDAVESLKEEIGRQIRGGEVDDYASKALQRIRSDISKTQEKMKQKAEQIMRANKSSLADSFSTLRNGRICIPVKVEYRKKIAGSVIDKSSTGNTLFIEPVGVAELYEKIELLKIEEENEVYRILYTLTVMVADHAEVMENNIRMIEKLDFIFSKGKLSLDLDAVEPSINLERRIELKNARHPLMEKKSCVPLQFTIGGKVNGIVITGPNTGGKTVSIKTVALNCLMAQCGLHVTCQKADICMNSSFLCDIGDGQNLTENLSTFSSHIKNVLEIIDKVDQESLVVLDELGSGTDPTEGMGIAIAILEELRKSGCLFLVTTHYPEVKGYADKAEGVINARMEFDKESLRPTYRMIIGEAGESCAFHIARKLGMPERMLETARTAAYGQSVKRQSVKSQNAKMQCAGEYAAIDGLPAQKGTVKKQGSKIKKVKKVLNTVELSDKYHIGDSVMVYPDKKIGIVCEPVNEKGVLRVQMPDKKIFINHKRVKLHVAASELYPKDYDFSIVFDTVEERKLHHKMERKYVDEQLEILEK